MQTAKTLIRPGGCPGRSEFSLGAHHFVGFVVLWLHYSSINSLQQSGFRSFYCDG